MTAPIQAPTAGLRSSWPRTGRRRLNAGARFAHRASCSTILGDVETTSLPRVFVPGDDPAAQVRLLVVMSASKRFFFFFRFPFPFAVAGAPVFSFSVYWLLILMVLYF